MHFPFTPCTKAYIYAHKIKTAGTSKHTYLSYWLLFARSSIWLPFNPWWTIVRQPHLRAIACDYLKCALASPVTFRNAPTPPPLFCTEYSWGDPLVGYLERVDFTTWHSQHCNCRPSLVRDLSFAPFVFLSHRIQVPNPCADQVVRLRLCQAGVLQ